MASSSRPLVGGASDRMLPACDTGNGKPPREYEVDAAIVSRFPTFSIGGIQCVAGAAGRGVDAAFVEGLMHDLSGREPQEFV